MVNNPALQLLPHGSDIPPLGEPVLQSLLIPFHTPEDQETMGGREKQLGKALIRTAPAMLPSPLGLRTYGEVAWWLLGSCLERIRILDVRHSDHWAPWAIQRSGRKKRITQLSENACPPPTPP